MKFGGVTSFASLALMLLTCSAFAQSGGQFSTVQNSTLSVPASQVLSAIASNGAAVGSSNWMLSAVAPTSAQGGVASLATSQEWVRRYSGGGGSSQNTPLTMAVRKGGSIVLCGYSLGQQTSYDFFTLCYAADGTALWTNRYDGPGHGNDIARLLAVNAGGEVWVAGESRRYATNYSLNDVVLIKYASNGIPVWTNRMTSFETNSAYPAALVVDNSGNSYVSFRGSYQAPPLLGQLVESVILKFDTAGNSSWGKRFPYSVSDPSELILLPGFLTIDHGGRILLSGEVRQSRRTLGRFISKLSGDGATIWTNHMPFSLVDDLDAIAVGVEDSIVTIGTRYLIDSSIEVVGKYSSDGVSVWTNQLVAPNYDGGNVPQVQTDPAGNTFVVAGSPNSDGRSGSYQVVKIDPAGVPLWTNHAVRFGVTNSQISSSAVDNAGNLYLSGYAPLGTNSYSDYVITKYSGDGRTIWTNRFDGTAGRSDIPFGMGVDDSGSVFLTGRSQGQSGEEIATVKYSDSLVYSPPSDFVGTDFVSLTLTDHLGAGADAQVEIIVSPGAFQFIVFLGSITLTPAGVELYGEGIPNETPVILEVSHDMKSWQPVATNTPVFGFVMFIDSTPNGLRRFYRMSQRP